MATMMKRKKRKGSVFHVVSVRMLEPDFKRIYELAGRRCRSVSAEINRLVLRELAAADGKISQPNNENER